jgi:hydroxymethylpyrimidine/phosphomethylpyrimidine kinase
MPRPLVLVIAGTDSSGGAGLLRDARTLERMGVDVACAVTTVTAQTDAHVRSVHSVPPTLVRAQIAAAVAGRAIGAIKIGMLGTQAAIEAVAEALDELRGAAPVVLDPVLYASSGAALLDRAGLAALRSRLFPLTTLLTPNLPEAAYLARGGVFGGAVSSPPKTRLEWADTLLAQGPRSVLLKGGHGEGPNTSDVLVRPGHAPLWLTAERLDARMRGTGCALASAIAAALASGADLVHACRRARAHVRELLTESGSGTGASPHVRHPACPGRGQLRARRMRKVR